MSLSGFSITLFICHLLTFVLVFHYENLDTSYFYTFQVLFERFSSQLARYAWLSTRLLIALWSYLRALILEDNTMSEKEAEEIEEEEEEEDEEDWEE